MVIQVLWLASDGERRGIEREEAPRGGSCQPWGGHLVHIALKQEAGGVRAHRRSVVPEKEYASMGLCCDRTISRSADTDRNPSYMVERMSGGPAAAGSNNVKLCFARWSAPSWCRAPGSRRRPAHYSFVRRYRLRPLPLLTFNRKGWRIRKLNSALHSAEAVTLRRGYCSIREREAQPSPTRANKGTPKRVQVCGCRKVG